MFAHLVSFSMYSRKAGSAFGSHVMELAEPPLTSRSLDDLRISLAMMYESDSVLVLNWDFLPDQHNHPGCYPYGYHVSFRVQNPDGEHFGSGDLVRSRPLDTQEELRSAEDYLRLNAQSVVRLIGCKPLIEVSAKALQNFKKNQQ